ncbi:pinin/SDK/memA/ protein conserved region-domain-containing protein [Aspergillus floccosus]
MADASLASAVVIPEQESTIPSPDAPTKRRNSSLADDPTPDSKRRRLSTHEDHPPQPAHSPDRQPANDNTENDRRSRPAGRREEDRKRGRRLFGALLGTLSQSSSSAAQKRRADIERRQQDKLKLQDEEYDELKRKRREERAVVRRCEQRVYEAEAMRTRHANLRATAHFLKTQSEPVLYFKPWQLRPADEDTIRDQIEEAEATIARETAEFEARYPPQDEKTQEDSTEAVPAPDNDAKEGTDGAEVSDKVAKSNGHDGGEEVKADDVPASEYHNAVAPPDQADGHRGADDDGGEVVEDQEDTVEY